MKKLIFSFSAIALLALGASRASADQISAGTITTSELGTSSKHDNWSSGTQVTLHPNTTLSTITGTGGLGAANNETWIEPSSLSLSTGAVDYTFTFDNGDITFVLTDITSVFDQNLGGESYLDISGTGSFEEAGFTNTPGVFSYSANDSQGKDGAELSSGGETFSILAPVPEPSSLLLLGSGLLGAAFLLFRRNRSTQSKTAA